MKKHPVIKYILILIISGSCGALASRIFMNFEDGVVGAIKNFSEWFGSMTPALHISICLFLSLMSVYSIHKLKKLLNSITPENEDEIYDQIENQSNPGNDVQCAVHHLELFLPRCIHCLSDPEKYSHQCGCNHRFPVHQHPGWR